MRCSFLLALCTGLLSAGSPAHAEAVKTWRAGVAKVRITPEKPMWMSGYANRTKPAEGTLHDLWAKALVLQDPNGQRCVLVTLDLVGIERTLSQAACAELERKYRLPRSAILLSVSHTHTGPVVGSNLNAMYFLDEKQQKLVSDYAKALHRNLVRVVGEAIRNWPRRSSPGAAAMPTLPSTVATTRSPTSRN